MENKNKFTLDQYEQWEKWINTLNPYDKHEQIANQSTSIPAFLAGQSQTAKEIFKDLEELAIKTDNARECLLIIPEREDCSEDYLALKAKHLKVD